MPDIASLLASHIIFIVITVASPTIHISPAPQITPYSAVIPLKSTLIASTTEESHDWWIQHVAAQNARNQPPTSTTSNIAQVKSSNIALEQRISDLEGQLKSEAISDSKAGILTPEIYYSTDSVATIGIGQDPNIPIMVSNINSIGMQVVK